MEYPKWKLIVWRFVRVFIAGALFSIGTNLESIKSVNDVFPMLVVPALSAGLVAVAKALREYFAQGDYNSPLHRLLV